MRTYSKSLSKKQVFWLYSYSLQLEIEINNKKYKVIWKTKQTDVIS